MGKKAKHRNPISSSYDDRVMRVLQNLRHKDLQKECILRGLEFNLVIEKDHHFLVSWFHKNFDNTQDENRLTEYDAYIEDQLEQRGYKKGDAMMSPCLRMGYTKDIDTIDKPVDIKPKGNSTQKGPKKPKAEINQTTGVRSGTKKALTFDLSIQEPAIPLDNIIKMVLEKFPGAEPKSIKIWYKKALKQKSLKNQN